MSSAEPILISVIVVNWNTRDLLAQAIESLPQKNPRFHLRLIVVDNGSTDGSVAMLEERYPEAIIIENENNIGFARANNQALRVAEGEYALLLNSDAELLPGSLEAMVGLLLSKPEIGIAGARILHPDHSLQASYMDFPNLLREFLILSGIGRLVFGGCYPSHSLQRAKKARPVDYVSGACMLVRRDAFVEVGGFDESFFMYAEEVDLCYRMQQAGWQVWYQPAAGVVHLGGGSSRSLPAKREADLYQSRVQYFLKHHGRFPAKILAGMILILTAVKYVMHKSAKVVSRGKIGREVVPPRSLLAGLRNLR